MFFVGATVCSPCQRKPVRAIEGEGGSVIAPCSPNFLISPLVHSDTSHEPKVFCNYASLLYGWAC